jgi:hypothetical protein
MPRVAIAVFCLVLVWTSVAGFRPSPVRRLDGRALFVAGRCWLHGVSPYDPAAFARVWGESLGEEHRAAFVFAYPPTAAVLAIPLALLPWPAAGGLLDVLNGVALLVCLLACAALVRRWRGLGGVDARLWLGLAAAVGVGAVSGTLQLGQTGLVALAGALLCLVFADHESVALYAAAVVLASVKPQVTLFAVLVTFLFAGLRRIAAAAAAVAAVAVAGLALGGVLLHPLELVHALQSYRAVGANTGQELAGASALLAWAGIDASAPVLAVAGLAGMGLLLWADGTLGSRLRPPRAAVAPEAGLQACALPCLAFAASATFLPVHDYDAVAMLLPLAVWPALPLRWILALAPGLLAAARPNVVAALTPGVPSAAIAGAAALYVTLGFASLRWLERPQQRLSETPASNRPA